MDTIGGKCENVFTISVNQPFKAALNNIFISSVDLMTTCNVNGVACSDEPTENYHLTLKVPSTPQKVLASLSSLFWSLDQ